VSRSLRKGHPEAQKPSPSGRGFSGRSSLPALTQPYIAEYDNQYFREPPARQFLIPTAVQVVKVHPASFFVAFEINHDQLPIVIEGRCRVFPGTSGSILN
jgi:hypothetical protein